MTRSKPTYSNKKQTADGANALITDGKEISALKAELQQLENLLSIEEKKANLALSVLKNRPRKIWECLFFKKSGRPRRYIRKLLFHTSGRPRGVVRSWIFNEERIPRTVFYLWMTSQEYQSLPQASRLEWQVKAAHFDGNNANEKDWLKNINQVAVSPRTSYFLQRLQNN